jgi:hypothetical protein
LYPIDPPMSDMRLHLNGTFAPDGNKTPNYDRLSSGERLISV